MVDDRDIVPDNDDTVIGPSSDSVPSDDATVVGPSSSHPSGTTPKRRSSIPTISNYKIVQLVGEGGMGEVYEAIQEQPIRRHVALKVIKLGMDTREVVARFESERQALALMDHPNVSHVFEAGITDRGQPFFAMEFVKGVPITEYSDTHRLSTSERLELFCQVCEGVQHAHHKGIIHRDIKPTNVLVAIQDDRPVPKIIDFGLAKATAQPLTERTLFTELGQLIGTPEYMSPEQAEVSGLDVDTRTDVYSLGILLYELLVGALPFDPSELRRGGFEGIRKMIRDTEPARPSTRVTLLSRISEESGRHSAVDAATLSRQLRGDLDWIVMKAIEKDRTRRYASPMEMAADVRRYLKREPILARPPSSVYRLKKFIVRHKVGVATGAMVLVALFLGIVGTTVGMFRAIKAERVAREEAEAARQVSEFLEDLFSVSDPGEARGNTITAREILDSGAGRITTELAGQPLVQARLMTTMGRVYRRLGLYREARPLLEGALSTRAAEASEEPLTVARSQLELGWLLSDIGDYDASMSLFETALAVQREVLGEQHPDVARTISSMASIHSKTRRFDDAVALHEQALSIREKSLGPQHPDVSNSLNLLANVYVDRGEPEKAIPLYERALEIREQTLGDDHPRVAMVLSNLAFAHWRLGNYDDARPLSERSIQIQEKVLGPDHPDVAFALTNAANLLSGSGDHAGAQKLHERALEIRKKRLRYDHPVVADTYYNLACVTALQGRRNEAVIYLKESVDRGFAKPIIFEDSDLKSLHGDPEFESILAKIRERLGDE